MPLAITAPTGNIGSRLVTHLLEHNADLTLLVRNPDKIDPATRSRVRVAQGDLEDKAFVQTATEGADALFWLAPPTLTTPDQPRYYATLRENVTNAVAVNSIPYVVDVSSGGGNAQDAGPVTETFRTEAALETVAPQTLHLRCGSFMENFFNYLPMIAASNAFYGMNSPTLRIPLVATQDIAAVAAEKLLDPAGRGHSMLAVHGPEDLDINEAARILSEIAGREIRYVQVPAEAVRAAYLEMGASPSVADGLIKMFQAFSKGIYAAEPRTPESTTPTHFADWARANLGPKLTAPAPNPA